MQISAGTRTASWMRTAAGTGTGNGTRAVVGAVSLTYAKPSLELEPVMELQMESVLELVVEPVGIAAQALRTI